MVPAKSAAHVLRWRSRFGAAAAGTDGAGEKLESLCENTGRGRTSSLH